MTDTKECEKCGYTDTFYMREIDKSFIKGTNMCHSCAVSEYIFKRFKEVYFNDLKLMSCLNEWS